MRFSSFIEMLSFHAERTPDAAALLYGEKCIRYAALLAAVKEKSWAGTGCVGFLLSEPDAETVIGLLSAIAAQKQVVLLDGNADDDTLRELVAYADVDTLIGDEELCETLADSLCKPNTAEEGGRVLFFTSGTTERSKAVVLTEGTLCASAYNGGALLPLTPEDTLLCLLPLSHVFGFVCGLLWGLSCGAAVALGRGARHYMDDFSFYRPTAVSVVPLLLGFLIKNNLLNDELKIVLIGAGDCPPALISAAKALGKRVSFGYGLTETSSGVALSLGGDPYAMTVCPDDTVTIAEDGEVLIEAPTCVMQGYYKCESGDILRGGVLHTGDLGFLDGEGKLHITGRKKEILVLRDGTKIFLPEYEAAIAAALGPRDMAVVAKDGAPVLVTVGQESERAEITGRLKPIMRTLPRGQQLAGIVFAARPLPRTNTGKIKRWEIEP